VRGQLRETRVELRQLAAPAGGKVAGPVTGGVVVLVGASRHRVAGVPVHVRNRRVAERAGLQVAVDTPPAGAAWALLIPGTVAIQPALLEDLPLAACRLTGPGGEMAWGAPADLGAPGELPPRPAPAGGMLDASTASAARATTWRLLKQAGKPTDGPIARRVNRPISRVFSMAFVSLGMTPFVASLLCLAVGLAAAWFSAQTGWLALVLAGLLYQSASIADGIDGEMARAAVSDSARGSLIDTVVDNVTQAACIIGFAVGWFREGLGAVGQALAVVAAAGFLVAIAQAMVWTRRHAPDASLVHLSMAVRRAAEQGSSRRLKFAAACFPLLRRDVVSFVFMLVCLTGSREVVLGLIVLGLSLGLYTINVHAAELAAAAEPGGGVRSRFRSA
jgi:1L-myo-inositol 1-phosphate cytidylyltransferase / CDP-L-myo-inositol myo-inositolphosphotransferase